MGREGFQAGRVGLMKEQELRAATHSNFLLPTSPQLQLQLPHQDMDTIPTHLLKENTELRVLH